MVFSAAVVVVSSSSPQAASSPPTVPAVEAHAEGAIDELLARDAVALDLFDETEEVLLVALDGALLCAAGHIAPLWITRERCENGALATLPLV